MTEVAIETEAGETIGTGTGIDVTNTGTRGEIVTETGRRGEIVTETVNGEGTEIETGGGREVLRTTDARLLRLNRSSKLS